MERNVNAIANITLHLFFLSMNARLIKNDVAINERIIASNVKILSVS
jgi:hypothetical protein